jgi:hypothetical protein
MAEINVDDPGYTEHPVAYSPGTLKGLSQRLT